MASFFQPYEHKPVCQWVLCYGSHIPPNAVPGGEDGGETSFIGRAEHENDVIPGKVLASHSCCYVAYYGAEHKYREYQVLVSNRAPLVWVPAANGLVPNGAIQGGTRSNGEPLYIGRTYHKGTLTPGKVHPSHNCLYIPSGGYEHRYSDYEVLVCKTINF
ncbi:natterin-3-like [Dermacentor variabilis]|uniref:natterin-3-like n=1 Tax=Dermacentor variabilis TaxID=34621 RepID=UPI003F5C3755